MKERAPIFYDAERVRWRHTRRVLEISGALLTLLLVYFFITIAVSVDLPAGLLPDTKLGYHALKTKKRTQPVREGRRRRRPAVSADVSRELHGHGKHRRRLARRAASPQSEHWILLPGAAPRPCKTEPPPPPLRRVTGPPPPRPAPH